MVSLHETVYYPHTIAHPLPEKLTQMFSHIRHEPRKLRYPLLFRVHIHRFHCTLCVSQQQLHNPDTALPSSGSPRVGFAVVIGTISVLRLPNAILPHFVSFAWQYHQSLSLFVPPAPLPRDGINSGLDFYGLFPLVTLKPRLSGGTLRVSQVPGESSLTFALIKDPGRATLPTATQTK